MIVGFKDKETEILFNEQFSRRLPIDIQKRALRKLLQMDKAISIDEFKELSSNHLEALSGSMAGYWSIRINDQWRIVFIPLDGGKDYTEVGIVDYH